MQSHTITLDLPEDTYLRMKNVAQATKQSVNQVFLRAIQTGSPPGWDDAPAEFQTDLAAIDRLDDGSLWHIARQRQVHADMGRYQELLDKNRNESLSGSERDVLNKLKFDMDRMMLCKAHAVSLLRWRGHNVPPAGNL